MNNDSAVFYINQGRSWFKLLGLLEWQDSSNKNEQLLSQQSMILDILFYNLKMKFPDRHLSTTNMTKQFFNSSKSWPV